MKIALILCCYNRPNYLKVCLESISRSNLERLNTLLIVDDGSTNEQTIELVNNFDLPNKDVIKYFKPMNKSIKDSLLYGYNLMFEQGHDIVMNLDADSLVNSDFLNQVLRLKEKYPALIVTGFCCDTLNKDGSVRHQYLYKEKDAIFRKSVGGINMCVGRAQYQKYMKPALIQTLQFGNNWDAVTCINSYADSLPIACVYPSCIQHIGIYSSMGHDAGGEPPDTADTFKPLSLPNVTLIGVADDYSGLLKAAKISITDIHFGAVKILSCFEKFNGAGGFVVDNPEVEKMVLKEPLQNAELIKVRKLCSKQEYSKFIFNELVDYIDTDYFIIFQADGFILNWRAWTNEFLNYDVVGAQWVWYNDGHRCSNGGFCLRSKRLHEVIKNDKSIVLRNDDIIKEKQEDHNIGRIYRPYLETNYGIKFAPDELCDQFSIEAWKRDDVRYKGSFGFHGWNLDFSKAQLPYVPYLLPNPKREIF